MIDYSRIEELILFSENVFITAHKNIDLDALGSILGMYYVVISKGKNAHIVIDDEVYNHEIERAIKTIKEKDDIVVERYSDIKDKITNKSLLVVTDTNRKSRVQNSKLLDIKNKVVIDHHIETSDTISDLIYKYIEIGSSSACEIVLEIIKSLNIYIPEEIATIMFAGIYVDTNGFLLKTTSKTHLYTSMLYEFGASNKEAQYLLKQDYNEFKRRQKLTLSTEFYNNIAITTSDSKYLSVELAKASDVLLTFNKVEASFSIAKLDDDLVGISARSLGNIDVEKIMNHFGGGGHKTDAATQINNKSVVEVKKELLEYLGGLDESNIH